MFSQIFFYLRTIFNGKGGKIAYNLDLYCYYMLILGVSFYSIGFKQRFFKRQRE